MNKETDLTYLSSLTPKFGKTQAIINNLQQENKQLKERIEYLERSIERQEEKAIENYNDYIGILTNWNKLKNIAKSQSDFKQKLGNDRVYFEIDELLDKMQELEKGDSNE